ncbi:MAG TPA: YsnF/AvaK domain-containing protein [Clostridia bacterium]
MKNLFGKPKDENDKEKNVEDGKLYLRKEELDISKNKVKVGEVEISKEIVEEQKVVDVPVTQEEVIIERRAIDNEPSDLPIGVEETIHIPVSEETVEVGKRTVVTGEVSANKRQKEETRQVRETLNREEARLRKEGNPNIVSDDPDSTLH